MGSAGIAWLLVPAGIRLIQSQHTGSLHSEAVRKGRLFALLVVLASNAFSYLALKWEGSLIAAHSVSPLFRKLAIHPAMVLLVAFPYMLLWIALSLLSSEEAEMVEIPSPS